MGDGCNVGKQGEVIAIAMVVTILKVKGDKLKIIGFNI